MTSLITYVDDVLNGCPQLADASVDLSFTSPPYFEEDGYTDGLMAALGRIWARVLRPGHRAFLNFGQIKEKFDRPLDAQRLVLQGGGGQLMAAQEIIWVKSIAVGGWSEEARCPDCNAEFDVPVETLSRGHYQPITSKQIMHYCWEHVFTFVRKADKKRDVRPLNRNSIGVPFADKSNLSRGSRGKNGDLHCAGDIWFIPYPTTGPSTKKAHRHQFPIELPKKAIKLSGIPKGGLVLDPFMGSGTTLFAARELGMSSVRIINAKTVDGVRKVWEGKEGISVSRGEENVESVDHS